MKRLIIGVVAAMAMVPLAMAQEQDTEILMCGSVIKA